jgi:hypothetical protein
MSNKTGFIVFLLLVALALGSIASIRAQPEPAYAPQLSEFGPMPGPFNPNEPPDDHTPPSSHG